MDRYCRIEKWIFKYFKWSYTSISDVKYIRIDAIKENKGKKLPINPNIMIIMLLIVEQGNFGIPRNFFIILILKFQYQTMKPSKVYFKIIHDENDIVTSMKGRLKFRDHSNLSRGKSYFVRGNKILLVRHNTFFIEDYTFIKRLKNEFKNHFEYI